MKVNSGNFILGFMVSVVLLLMIFWMIKIQTQKECPDVMQIVVEKKEREASVKRGADLFLKESCYNCHKVDKRSPSGYMLRNVSKRRSRDFLFQFIRNEDSLYRAKHLIVLELKREYNYANGLHNKKYLTDEELDDIINYLDSF